MTNGSELPDRWNGNPIPPRPPLPPIDAPPVSEAGIPVAPPAPPAPPAPGVPVPVVPAVPAPDARNVAPGASVGAEPEPAKFKIGMPPGMNFDPDTVPSSDFPAVVPVAKPEFPPAPTPQAAAPGPNHDEEAGTSPSLVLPDGTVLPLAGGLVVGRDPLHQAGYPASVLARLHDVERSVSKTHAALGLSADGAWVVDLNSTNGTFLVAADGSLTPCIPEVPTPLAPGVDIRFGEYRVRVRLG